MASANAVSSLAAKATGTGDAVDFATAKTSVTAVLVAKGTVTGGVVLLQGSQDNSNWANLFWAQAPLTGTSASHHLPPRGAFRYYRAKIMSDITGGGNIDATFMEADV